MQPVTARLPTKENAMSGFDGFRTAIEGTIFALWLIVAVICILIAG